MSEDWDTKESKNYVMNDGKLCPNCGSEFIEGDGPMEMTTGRVYQKIRCNDCRATWDADYVLRGCSNLEVPVPDDPQDDPPPDWPDDEEADS